MGIEPTYEAWEAAVLPLNYTRGGRDSTSTAATQCGVLSLTTASGHCAVADYHVYSLVSPTADAASAAAANERVLAEQAVSLAPPSACTASIQPRPTPACVANTCQAAASAN